MQNAITVDLVQPMGIKDSKIIFEAIFRTAYSKILMHYDALSNGELIPYISHISVFRYGVILFSLHVEIMGYFPFIGLALFTHY